MKTTNRVISTTNRAILICAQFLVLFAALCVPIDKCLAQTYTLSGTVSDSAGQAVVGAEIKAIDTDACDPAPQVRINSMTSNEPVNGLGFGDMAPDWQITGALTLNLRAERSRSGTGRVYTITVEAADASENRTAEERDGHCGPRPEVAVILNPDLLPSCGDVLGRRGCARRSALLDGAVADQEVRLLAVTIRDNVTL